jgi:UDP-glucose 4-epimerase
VRVLVTGGAGFIGSHLVRALVAEGHAVRVLDDLSSGDAARLTPLGAAVDLLVADVRDAAACDAACRDVDAILHEAAEVSVPRSLEDPARTADVNVTGTVRLLEAARRHGVGRFVLASSCSVYGNPRGDAQAESDTPAPLSPYAASKLAGEQFVACFSHHGVPGLALRYFNVYGAGQRADSAYAAAMPAFLAALRRHERPVLFGDGRQARDFVHVDDVVSANLLALAAPDHALGRAFNVGTGRAVAMVDVARRLAEALGVEPAFSFGPPRAGDVLRSRADVRAATADLGFTARIDLDEGLRRMLGG